MQEQGPFGRRARVLPRHALRLVGSALALGLLAAACSSGGSASPNPGAPGVPGASPSAAAGASASPSRIGSAGAVVAGTAASDSTPEAAEPEPSPAAAPTATLPPDAIRLARVANTDGQGANLRAEPSAASRRIKVVREGTELELIGSETRAEGRTWRNVRDEDGQTGWVLSEFLVDERVTGPRPTPTPAPTIQVTDITSPVNRGEPATLTIVTRPGLRCEVRVLLFGPGTAPREGLEPKVANESGECSWTWRVPPETVPGAWRYAIAVGSGEQRATREVSFGVR